MRAFDVGHPADGVIGQSIVSGAVRVPVGTQKATGEVVQKERENDVYVAGITLCP